MNKRDIVRKLAARTGMRIKDAEAAVDIVISELRSESSSREYARLPGPGKSYVITPVKTPTSKNKARPASKKSAKKTAARKKAARGMSPGTGGGGPGRKEK
jgi:nucleoid DNA-binding protein